MRHFIIILASLFVFGSFTSCKDSEKHLSDATGAPYDAIVVTSEGLWNGAAGDSLRFALQRPGLLLNQPEPDFDLSYTTPKGFTSDVVKRHRNIIILRAGSEYVKPTVSLKKEWNAVSQIVVTIQASTPEALATFIGQNKDKILDLLEQTEQDRFVSRINKYNEKIIVDTLKNIFDIDIKIPLGYKIRNIDTLQGNRPDFAWISLETLHHSQGIVVYDYPYNKMPLDTINLIAKRNEFVKLIPGPGKGTFMTTSTVMPVYQTSVTINGRMWMKLEGFWDVKGDFMGGSFINFSTVDVAKNRVIAIDTYIYSPTKKGNRRNYVRQLESIIKTVKIP